jgi:hypothetical protein
MRTRGTNAGSASLKTFQIGDCLECGVRDCLLRSFAYRFREIEKYNELCQPSDGPQHLVLYTLPPLRWQWVRSEDKHAVLNHCCYFLTFDRLKPVTQGSGKTVQVPIANRLTAGELIRMYRDAYQAWTTRE